MPILLQDVFLRASDETLRPKDGVSNSGVGADITENPLKLRRYLGIPSSPYCSLQNFLQMSVRLLVPFRGRDWSGGERGPGGKGIVGETCLDVIGLPVSAMIEVELEDELDVEDMSLNRCLVSCMGSSVANIDFVRHGVLLLGLGDGNTRELKQG